jgi:hypothetical protein
MVFERWGFTLLILTSLDLSTSAATQPMSILNRSRGKGCKQGDFSVGIQDAHLGSAVPRIVYLLVNL